jgi:hypothetical protein
MSLKKFLKCGLPFFLPGINPLKQGKSGEKGFGCGNDFKFGSLC